MPPEQSLTRRGWASHRPCRLRLVAPGRFPLPIAGGTSRDRWTLASEPYEPSAPRGRAEWPLRQGRMDLSECDAGGQYRAMSIANERFFAYRRVVVEVALAPDEVPGGSGGVEAATDDAAVPAVTPVMLELSGEEREVLTHILDVYVSDLRMEISATDNPSMRRALRHEEDLLKALVVRLR